MSVLEEKKQFIVMVVGLSGAGLKTGINILEDSGIHCIDNLPIGLIYPAITVLTKDRSLYDSGIGFGVHVREKESIDSYTKFIAELNKDYHLDMIFLTASDEVLESRYSANRRKHPFLKPGQKILEAIKQERLLLKPIAAIADLVLDTSQLSPQQLGQLLEERYHKGRLQRRLYVSLMSFGFKYGQCWPIDSLFDARFLLNPYFVPSLKNKTGLEQEVRDYIFREDEAKDMLKKLTDWHLWVLPQYYKERKHYFRIGIGCTGGKHRSVSMVEELYKELSNSQLGSIVLTKSHRDLHIKD